MSKSEVTEHYSLAYEPMVRREEGPVEREGVAPSPDAQEVDVWFTEWQVAEDGLDVEVGNDVDWALVPMDLDWVTRLFAGRQTIPFRFDTYGSATREPSDPDWTSLTGRVVRIDQVSTLRVSSQGSTGDVPAPGDAMQHEVRSFTKRRTHRGDLVGWVVRVRRVSPAR
jgi:hypothetical protein